MKDETRTIYITKEAKDALKRVDTKMPEYKLASELILAGIKARGVQ